jgi:hypothetical protein
MVDASNDIKMRKADPKRDQIILNILKILAGNLQIQKSIYEH